MEVRDLKINPAKFYITICKPGHIILQRINLKVLTKAFNESEAKGKPRIKELKSSKVWELLQ
jgi:hypothetical protein